MKKYKLIFILSFVFLSFILGCGKQKIMKVSKPKIAVKPPLEELENEELDNLLKELKQKNPFRADHATGALPINLGTDSVLKGIIWDAQKPFAIIKDTVVVQGDYVDGKKVIRIDKDAVTLEREGTIEVLRLEEPLQ